MAGKAKASDLEQAIENFVSIPVTITLRGNTTAASITTFSNLASVQVFNNLTSLTAPADASFTSLVNVTAPAVVGIYASVGDALRLVGVDYQSLTLSSVSITGVTPTKKADGTGVTPATKNLSFQISCTTLDLDAQTADHSFDLVLRYVRDARQA